LARDACLCVAPQSQTARIALKTEIAPAVRLIADERAIRQILVNLLSNAIKFSPPGGEVTVFAEPAKNGALAVGVADHGVGMDEAGLKKALEPYGQVSLVTTVEGCGTGLGLPIVKALIEAHGAVFRIASAPGSGTRVWGEFPAARVPAGEKAA
jgi:signal transduction histidine kinase